MLTINRPTPLRLAPGIRAVAGPMTTGRGVSRRRHMTTPTDAPVDVARDASV